jgi:glucosamine--fructose-6-phosphate aminotransferase (isomerizing)
MCGIIGYVGKELALPILLAGLDQLEYRGYDSAGVYVPDIGVKKAVGPVAALKALLTTHQATATSGIAHTRWATHGPPAERNAHPHHDARHRVYVVHNGIIENYELLKDMLASRGVTFSSDTDTEVLAALIAEQNLPNLQDAVVAALGLVRGAYGIAVMRSDDPNTIVVARYGSPLVIGIGDHGHFVASDAAALLPHTRDVVYLADGDVAVITAGAYAITVGAGPRLVEKISGEVATVQKQGYEHFMLKEIFEGPAVIEATLRGRLLLERGRAKLGGLELVREQLREVTALTFVGCGSAYYAGLVGRTQIETYARLPVTNEIASEFRYAPFFPSSQRALIAISQSGETADTLAAIAHAQAGSMMTLGIVNVVGSAIARATMAGVYNHAGPELAVASTKAFLSQVTVTALLALFFGREREVMSVAEGQQLVRALEALPEQLARVLETAPRIKEIAERYAHCHDFMYIGRRAHAAIAAEGALKMKEVTYAHAEAYPAGELKHGSIALVSSECPVVALVPEDDVYEKMISNVEEVKARGAPVVAVTTTGATAVAGRASDVMYVPKTHPAVQPILSTVPLQLLAYYVGVARGLNVDRPRNLAKSVTVE